MTTKQAIAANEKGESYRVSFKLAPTVWSGASQATAQGDGVIVRLINEDGRVVASQYLAAVGWDGGKNAGAYKDAGFTYTGDGSGSVRVQL